MDNVDFSMDAVKRHLYNNDCYQRLDRVHMTDIEKIILNPSDTLRYVIQKYSLQEELGTLYQEPKEQE
ncbi:MAG: hypothetical protein PWP24_1007 [Clostridiales bacterium]|nr:hypothetical protein [Clostridiales bacterium]